MNDFELESMLKNLPVPERSRRYWNDFPAQVRAQLQSQPAPAPAARPSFSSLFWRFTLGSACLATTCLALNQPLHQLSVAVAQNEINLSYQIQVFPRHLHALMACDHGLHYLVANKN